MKKSLFTIIAISIALNCFSQTQSKWTKEDRNNLYGDCMNSVSVYSSVSKDQKETICLCYIEELTKKYTKEDFNAKIDIELKRILEAILSQCSKNIGVDLVVKKEEPKVEEPKKATVSNGAFQKSSFVGTWTFEDGEYTFYDDGEFKFVSPKHDAPARGKWFLNEKTLLLKDTTFFQWGSDEFEIVSVSSNEIVMIRAAGKKTCHLKKKV